MSANLEIKARVADPGAFRARARAVATRDLGAERQVDTYFRVATGRLKLRESSRSGGMLVPYLRPDGAGPRRSEYQVIPVPDPEEARALLTEILGVLRVVRKRREVWLHDNVRIHLDAVEGLGDFMELEAVFDGSEAARPGEERKVEALMRRLGVRPGDRVETSYEALLGETP